MIGYNIGSRNPRWKGGKYKRGGYGVVLNDGKYIPEHVVIFEKYHRCCMLEWGHVHHINHIRDDNRIENLQGLTRSQHFSLHTKKDLSNRTCAICNESTMIFRGQAYWYKSKDGNGFICYRCYSREQWRKRTLNKFTFHIVSRR